jgi:hypothetical protein
MPQKSWKLIQFAYACLIALWLIGNTALLVKQYNKGELFVAARNGVVYINDFVHFYVMAKIALSTDREKAYEVPVQQVWMDTLIAPLKTDKVFFVQCMPTMFALSAPLGFLPMDMAYIAWTLVCTIFGIIALYLLLKHKQFNNRDKCLFTLGALASLPSFMCLQLGEIAWAYLAVIIALFYFSWIKPNSLISGLMLALTSIKPHYTLFFAVPYLVGKRWLILIWAFIFECLLLVLTSFFVGWQNIINYPKIVLALDASKEIGGVHAEHMVSMRSLLTSLLPEAIALKAAFLLMLLGLLFCFFLWHKILKKENPSNLNQNPNQKLAWGLAISILLCLLLSPHTHLYDCLMLILPIALTISSISLYQTSKIENNSLKTWTFLSLLYPLLSAIIFILWEYVSGFKENPIPFIIWHLAMLICACIYLFRLLKTFNKS